MPNAARDLLADLVPAHELVDDGPGQRLHVVGHQASELGVVGLVGDHWLVQQALRLADMELTVCTAHVGARACLAAPAEVVVVLDQVRHPLLRSRVGGVGGEDSPVNLGDIGATVGRGFVVGLLDVVGKPALIGVVTGVGDGGNCRLQDGVERDKGGVDDVPVGFVLVGVLVVFEVFEFVGCRRWIRGCGGGRGGDGYGRYLWVWGS